MGDRPRKDNMRCHRQAGRGMMRLYKANNWDAAKKGMTVVDKDEILRTHSKMLCNSPCA